MLVVLENHQPKKRRKQQKDNFPYQVRQIVEMVSKYFNNL